MEIKAGRFFKIAYCLILIGTIYPAGFVASSGWIGLALGGGLFSGGIFIPLSLLLLFLYRITSVIRNPSALNVYVTGLFSKAMRAIAVFLIYTGLVSIVGLFLVKPITLAIFRSAGDAGVGYFVVGIYFAMLAPLGMVGVILFEFVRSIGARHNPSPGRIIPEPSLQGGATNQTAGIKKFLHARHGLYLYLLIVLTALTLVWHTFSGTMLRDAITYNNLSKAKTLIAFGADVNSKNDYGSPIIHHAVLEGNPELVELLISKGADVNANDGFDRVALHYANKKGIAKILLEHGAIVDSLSNFGETPLHWAASNINSMGKQVDLVEFADTLIAHGADVNRKTGKGRSYKTPLNYAAESNNLAVAKLLIAHGADVEGGGSSPLSSAGVNGDYVEMAQLLVESGAGVNTPSPTGWYPLETAAGRGNIKVLNFLLSHGADPNLKLDNGFTALYSAAASDHSLTSAEALLNHGADPNIKCVNGFTALHQASSQGATQIIKVLLAHKANINATNSSGVTPLHQAISYGVAKAGSSIVETLVKNGADVNAKDNDGSTPLRKAIERGNIEIVRFLIESGADVNAPSKNGVSLFYLARKSDAIIGLLVEKGAR